MTIQDIKDITSFKWATVVTVSPLSIKLDGDSAPLAMIPDSLVDPYLLSPGSRVRVELSLRKAIIHGTSQGGFRGTTAERDARFGVPVTTPEHVELANAAVAWFNTDLGWEESYYATNGFAGLNSGRRLRTDVVSGWYPTGYGVTPEILMNPFATFAATSGNYVGNWNGNVIRKGGASSFLHGSQGPQILRAGYYDISLYTVQPLGTGIADYHIRLLDGTDGVTVDWQHNLSGIELNGTYYSAIGAQFKSLMVLPGAYLRWYVSSGTLTLHNTSGPVGSGRGEMHVRYVRPALISD